jgi:hypothetical protein
MPISRIIRIISTAAVGSLLLSAGAHASGWKSPRAALHAAHRALDPAGHRGTQEDATLALRDLHMALPRLHGDRLQRARQLLARPTDARDPYKNSYRAPEAAPFCTAHFCVHYVTSTPDAPDLTDLTGPSGVPDGVPDYVEKIDTAAETSYAIENGQLQWPAPRSDGKLGGSPITDIYLVNVGGDGLFGYSAPDPGQACSRKCFAFLVMDNDFSKAEFGYDDPQIPLEVTIAHEYNHVLQFGIDAALDSWLFESTATWSEEHVFPNDNDWVNYLNTFARTPGVPITKFQGGKGLRIYGLATFQHFIDSVQGLGDAAILGTWKNGSSTDPKDYAVGAMDKSLREHGGANFGKTFTRFAAATAEWRTNPAFPDAASYPDVQREGSLAPSPATQKVVLDHTAYRLFNVNPNAVPALKLTLKTGNVQAGIALVGRDSDTATTTTALKYLKKGGKGSVTLDDPSKYERVTAVVVNADGRIKGRSRNGRDWLYTNDDAALKVKLTG